MSQYTQDDIKIKRRPISARLTPYEHDEQKALIRVCKLHEKKYPGLELLFAIPNGQKRTIGVAKKLKAEGVKAGVPDLFLPVPRGECHGLFIELKAKGGRVSNLQNQMLTELSRHGYACIVAFGWEHAWNEIQNYMKTEKVYFLNGAW